LFFLHQLFGEGGSLSALWFSLHFSYCHLYTHPPPTTNPFPPPPCIVVRCIFQLRENPTY
jgi:hypothetical protein